jgi:Ca2+-binding EF-hand superfamily protein
LNEFLQAFDDLKITNIQSSELRMLFEFYDQSKTGKIHFSHFFKELIGHLPSQRGKLVEEAFSHID